MKRKIKIMARSSLKLEADILRLRPEAAGRSIQHLAIRMHMVNNEPCKRVDAIAVSAAE